LVPTLDLRGAKMQFNRPPAIVLPAGARIAKRKDRFFQAHGELFDAQRTATGITEIALYDEIGGPFGVTAKDFRAKLKDATGDVVLRINSPGGDVFQAVAIYNDLLAHNGKIRIEIVGLAASAASVVAMAGDEIAIAPSAFLMIHDSWGIAIGNSSDHADVSNLLDSRRTRIDARVIRKMMHDETWLQGDEALAQGFATEIIAPAEAHAKFDLTVYAKVPDQLRDAVATASPKSTNIRDFECFLRDAGGFSRSQAKALSAGGFSAIADHRDDEGALQQLAQHIASRAESLSHI
jgi:ATP-dependent Clp protease protease subunit